MCTTRLIWLFLLFPSFLLDTITYASSSEDSLRIRAAEFAQACIKGDRRRIYRFYDPILSMRERREERDLIVSWGYETMSLLRAEVADGRAWTRFSSSARANPSVSGPHDYFWLLRNGQWFVTVSGPWCARNTPDVAEDFRGFAESAKGWRCDEAKLLKAREFTEQFIAMSISGTPAESMFSAHVYLDTPEGTWVREESVQERFGHAVENARSIAGDFKVLHTTCFPGGVFLGDYYQLEEAMRDGTDKGADITTAEVAIEFTQSDGRKRAIIFVWVPEDGTLKLWQAM